MIIQKKQIFDINEKKIQIKHEKTYYKFLKIIVLVLRKYTSIPNNISRIDMFIKS